MRLTATCRGAGACWCPLQLVAVVSPMGGVGKLRWLLWIWTKARTALDLDSTRILVRDLTVAAAGQVEVEVVVQ